MKRVLYSRWFRFAVVVLTFGSALLALWWRGPEWGTVYHAFDFVAWRWIVAAFFLNLVSVLFRSFSWSLTIRQALPEPHPRFADVFSAFAIGLLGNAVLPARAGELARVAVLRKNLPEHGPGYQRDPDRHGVRTSSVRPDPRRLARPLRDLDRAHPALGGDQPDRSSSSSASRCSPSPSSVPSGATRRFHRAPAGRRS